jgi:hypothetical protein
VKRGLAFSALPVAVVLLGAGCNNSKSASTSSAATTAKVAAAGATEAPCDPPRVQYTPYPGHGEGLSQIPWIQGKPRESGLVALLWYWPENWQRRHLPEARIFTGGVAPAGYNVKVMWVFLGRSASAGAASELVVQGHRLDGPGRFRDTFTAIGYAGQGEAPSYASIIVVPEPGCWRLNLSTGELRAYADFRAVKGKT